VEKVNENSKFKFTTRHDEVYVVEAKA